LILARWFQALIFIFVYRWQKMLAILCHRWQKANTNQNYLSNPEQKKTSLAALNFESLSIMLLFYIGFVFILF